MYTRTARQLQNLQRAFAPSKKYGHAMGRDSHQKELERLAPLITAGADLFAAEQEHLIVHLDLSMQDTNQVSCGNQWQQRQRLQMSTMSKAKVGDPTQRCDPLANALSMYPFLCSEEQTSSKRT